MSERLPGRLPRWYKPTRAPNLENQHLHHSGEEKHPMDYIRTNISHQKCFFKESYAISLTRKPSFLAKVGCRALTSLPKLSRANIDSFWKVVGYRMHGTRLWKLFESSLCSSLTWDTLSYSDPSCHCWNRWDDSGPYEPSWLHLGYRHQQLRWSLSRIACDFLLEVSPFSDRKEFGCEECRCKERGSSSQGSRVDAWNLATVWERWLTRGQRCSMFWMKGVWKISISPSCSVYKSGSPLLISYLETWTVICQASTIEPVTLTNLMVSFCH